MPAKPGTSPVSVLFLSPSLGALVKNTLNIKAVLFTDLSAWVGIFITGMILFLLSDSLPGFFVISTLLTILLGVVYCCKYVLLNVCQAKNYVSCNQPLAQAPHMSTPDGQNGTSVSLRKPDRDTTHSVVAVRLIHDKLRRRLERSVDNIKLRLSAIDSQCSDVGKRDGPRYIMSSSSAVRQTEKTLRQTAETVTNSRMSSTRHAEGDSRRAKNRRNVTNRSMTYRNQTTGTESLEENR